MVHHNAQLAANRQTEGPAALRSLQESELCQFLASTIIIIQLSLQGEASNSGLNVGHGGN